MYRCLINYVFHSQELYRVLIPTVLVDLFYIITKKIMLIIRASIPLLMLVLFIMARIIARRQTQWWFHYSLR